MYIYFCALYWNRFPAALQWEKMWRPMSLVATSPFENPRWKWEALGMYSSGQMMLTFREDSPKTQ